MRFGDPMRPAGICSNVMEERERISECDEQVPVPAADQTDSAACPR
jgi:hypothetical protein